MTTVSLSSSDSTRRRLARWLPTEQYPDPLGRFRAYASYGTSLALIVVALALLVLVIYGYFTAPSPRTPILLTVLLLLAGGPTISIFLVRAGRQRAGGWATCLTFEIGLLLILGFLPPIVAISTFLSTAEIWGLLTIAALLLRSEDLRIIGIFVAIDILLVTLRVAPLITSQVLLFGLGLGAGAIGQVAIVSLLMRIQLVATGQANVVLTRADRFAQTGQAIVQAATRLPEADPFMATSVQLIRSTSAEVAQVQIWRMEAAAARRSGSVFSLGATSDKMENELNPGVALISLLTQVAENIRPLRIQDEPGVLSGMGSQLMLPIRAGEHPLGVLIIASTEVSTFTDEDLTLTQGLANQIALGLDNARLRVEQRTLYVERQRLTEELRVRQAQIERQSQQNNALAWNEYLQTRTADQPVAFTLDLQSGQIDSYAEWTAPLQQAVQTGQSVSTADPGAMQTVALPLTIQGNTIGALEFELAPGQATNAEQIAILEQMMQETAFAIENARLTEESQRTTRREALASAISARLQNSNNVEAVLTNAVQSLADVLHAPRITIRLTDRADEMPIDANHILDERETTP